MGKLRQQILQVLSKDGTDEEDETAEDTINRLIEAHRLLPNASYFAFTATPKHKTLEIFGKPEPQADGTTKHFLFHSYTMKQAIEEGFILDVLTNYTPVNSYYRLTKTIKDDPKFDSRRAQKKLQRYVDNYNYAIQAKAEIMVDHFYEQVLTQKKIGGQARAMVVTSGIKQAIQYFHAISKYLIVRQIDYKAIVAFSGTHEIGGEKTTEASLNGFSSANIVNKNSRRPLLLLNLRR